MKLHTMTADELETTSVECESCVQWPEHEGEEWYESEDGLWYCYECYCRKAWK